MCKQPHISFLFAGFLVLLAGRGLAVDPDVDEFGFAEGLFVHKDYRSAVEEFTAFVKKFPESKLAAAAGYRIGECHLRLADHEAAATAFEQALNGHPDAEGAPLGAYNLGRARRHLKQPERALAAFSTAIGKGTGQVREEALVGAGECLVDLKRFEEAAKTYSSLLADFPTSKHRPAALFSMGWLNGKLSHHEQAVKAFTTLLGEFPKHESAPKAALALSDAYAALGQFAKSADALKSIAGAAELGSEVMLRKAWNQFKSGSKKEAGQSFAVFADTFPKNPQAPSARFNAGIACFDTSDYETALKQFNRVLKEFPKATEAPLARYWAGLSLFNLGKHAEACAMLKPLVGENQVMDPAKRDVFDCVYAQALAKTGKHAESIAQLRAFLKRAPTSEQAPAAAYALAQSLQHTGDLPGAVSVLEGLLKDLPDGPLRRNALFAIGEYLFRLKQPKRALPYLEELAQAEPRNAKALYRLAWTYFELERFEEAQKRFSALPELSKPFTNEALFLSGRAAEKLEKKEQAITAYERLTASAPTDPFTEKAMSRLAFLYEHKEAEQNLVRYEKHFAEGKHLGEIRLKVAEARFSAGDTDGAAALYAKLLKQPATSVTTIPATYGAAWCSLRSDKLAEADQGFAAVSKAKDAPPEMHQDALLQRGEIAYRQKEFGAACPFFEAVKDDPTRGERAVYMLGWCSRKLDDVKAEEHWFREAVSKHPKGRFQVDSTLRLAELHNRLGQPETARDLLKRVVDSGVPEGLEEDILHAYCEALVGVKDWKAVLVHAGTLQQKYADAERLYLAVFRLGVAHQALGLLDEAEKNFRDTIARTDTIEAARAQFNIGSIFFSRKDFVAAAKSFLRVDLMYDYPELAPKSLYHAVDAFRRAGETRRADLYARKLVEEYATSEWAAKVSTADKKKP